MGVSKEGKGMHMTWKQKTGTCQRRKRIGKRGVGRAEGDTEQGG